MYPFLYLRVHSQNRPGKLGIEPKYSSDRIREFSDFNSSTFSAIKLHPQKPPQSLTNETVPT